MNNNILIFLPNWIGDVVMSLPILNEARNKFASSNIKIVIREDIFPLIKENCKLLDIIPIFYNKKTLKETVKLISTVRRNRFDTGFILPRSYRMFIIALLGGIKNRYGYGDIFKNLFLKNSLKRDKKALSKHRVFYYLDILTNVEYKKYTGYPEIKISTESKNWADSFINENKLTDKTLIGLNPGATYGSAKCWGTEKFNRLIEKINQNVENVFFIVFGGKDNVEYNSEIKGENVINVTGKLSLAQSAAIISKCDLFITNDTGPMHIADALGVEIVAIFGSTDPVETPPFRMKKHIVYRKLPCSPCKERICPLKHHQCMLMITVEDVFNEVKKILEDINA